MQNVIASEAKQSQRIESPRLLRRCVPRNDILLLNVYLSFCFFIFEFFFRALCVLCG